MVFRCCGVGPRCYDAARYYGAAVRHYCCGVGYPHGAVEPLPRYGAALHHRCYDASGCGEAKAHGSNAADGDDVVVHGYYSGEEHHLLHDVDETTAAGRYVRMAETSSWSGCSRLPGRIGWWESLGRGLLIAPSLRRH